MTFISGTYLLRKRWISKGSRRDVVPFMITHFANVSRSISASASRKNKKGLAAVSRLDSVPESSILIFTDGSAIPNPGHTGAGAWVSVPGSDPVLLYESLGHGTNNKGELWAIGMALQYVYDNGFTQNVVVASDSEWAINKIRKCSPGSPELDIIMKSIIALTHSLTGKVDFTWIQSHRGVVRNEIADRLADFGSRRSRQTNAVPKVFEGHFTYCVKLGVMGADLGDG
jgi:ribonuclease HI